MSENAVQHVFNRNPEFLNLDWHLSRVHMNSMIPVNPESKQYFHPASTKQANIVGLSVADASAVLLSERIERFLSGKFYDFNVMFGQGVDGYFKVVSFNKLKEYNALLPIFDEKTKSTMQELLYCFFFIPLFKDEEDLLPITVKTVITAQEKINQYSIEIFRNAEIQMQRIVALSVRELNAVAVIFSGAGVEYQERPKINAFNAMLKFIKLADLSVKIDSNLVKFQKYFKKFSEQRSDLVTILDSYFEEFGGYEISFSDYIQTLQSGVIFSEEEIELLAFVESSFHISVEDFEQTLIDLKLFNRQL
jgi:hypothetical protein